MHHPKEYTGTTLKKGARAADPKGAQELAKTFTKEIPPLQSDDSINDLTDIIRNYFHEAYNSAYIQNHKLRDWFISFIKIKKEEIGLVWNNPDIADAFYPEHVDVVLQRLRGQIADAEERLAKLTGIPSHTKGDYLENDLIRELLRLRKKCGLSASHTNSNYTDSNDSTGACVPWVQLVVNTLAKDLGKTYSNQAIKERIIKIRSQNSELK